MSERDEKKVKEPVKVSVEEHLRQLANMGIDLREKPWLKPERISLRYFTEEQKTERRNIQAKIWRTVNKERVSALKKTFEQRRTAAVKLVREMEKALQQPPLELSMDF